MDDHLKFDYHSARAAKARLAYHLSGSLRMVLAATTIALLILGVAMLLIGMPLGWLTASFAVVPYMLNGWYKGELHHLPTGLGGNVDDLLSGDILGQLPEHPTLSDVAKAVGSVSSGLFMGARFGLTPNLLGNISSGQHATINDLWRAAEDVRKRANVKRCSGSVLAVALLQVHPERRSIIAQLHLDDEDLIFGVRWQQHLRDMAERFKRPRRSGGVARDWSFGYIPLLTRFGQNISRYVSSSFTVSVESHAKSIDQLVDTFSRNGRQNAVLVGPTGAGKTTIIHAFADRLLDAEAKLPSSLQFRQVFILDSSALIAAAPGRGELEGLVMRVLGEAFSAKNIIICLDNAQLFFSEGIGAVDLSNVLLPILEAGRLRVILSMDEQNYLQIAKRNPALANALNRVSVAPTNETETMLVLRERLIVTEAEQDVIFTYQSLKEAYRLSRRYVYDVAQPGQAMRLLESAARYADGKLVTINSVQQAIEQTMDVKVSVASDAGDREKLLNLESHIHERMINQVRAVKVVSDALRRARSGVRNQNRPIGTFLFLGPTGVGKTELAKALAEVYFGGEDRLIRIDLNEFVRPDDVSRLIADGADDPLSLTAQVMKKPFSVILLDEIEKAAPEVLATLLQLLDEGILRDIKNREISFRDAIIIATSNAGANRIREYIERGYQVSQFEGQFLDELVDSGQFRPEFLNRFDEMVVFTPLSKPDLLKVVDLIIAGVNKTLSPQKISVAVDDGAKQLLVEKGYDPRLGARPMRRVVQRAVENTVAKVMLAGAVESGEVVKIDREQVESSLGATDAEMIKQ